MHSKRLIQNPKVLKDLLKAKWLKEIKEDNLKTLKTSGLLKWQIKSKKYYVKDKYTTLLEMYQKWYCQ